MTDQTRLAMDVLRKLQSVNALRDIVLIGSWCHIVYSRYFDTDELSILRTSDIDFLIPQDLKTKNDVDIGKLFESLGFAINHEHSGLIKYENEELEIQFLTNEKAKGKNPPVYEIKQYHIYAEGLRFVDLLFENSFDYDYLGLKIRLPLPEAYVLQKILIINRRKNQKIEKDLKAIEEIGDQCLKDPERTEGMKKIFINMPQNWQKQILKNIEEKKLINVGKILILKERLQENRIA